jgi:NAD(P)-dependent dehydrogenase (short-subunit alcohol dehydrogenase family)
MHRAGADIILAGRDEQALIQSAREISPEGRDVSIACFDVTDEQAIAQCFENFRAENRVPNILVNNAGIVYRSTVAESRTDQWRAVIETNLVAAYNLSREAAVGMVDQNFGRIINIASILALQGKARASAYTASKHGIAGLTKALAAELGHAGITANAICPGYVRTDINRSLQNDPSFDAKVLENTPCGRWGMPEDIAGPAIFLASDAAAYVNGHLLVVDGGMTATH